MNQNDIGQNKKMKICLNCDTPLAIGSQYCSNCGQKSTAYKLTIKEIFLTFWQTVFNLDNKILTSFKHIYQPSFLTREYISGKKLSYFHPMRLFIVLLIILFTLATSYINFNSNYLNNKFQYSLMEEYSIRHDLDQMIDSIGNEDFCKFRDELFVSRFHKSDFLLHDDPSDYLDNFQVSENISLNLGDFKKYKITYYDLLFLSPDSILTKYHIENFKDRIFITQSIKFMFNKGDFLKSFIKNSTWAILVTSFFLSALLLLLYFRNDVYYIEHLILQLYIHSIWFLIIIFDLIFIKFIPTFDQSLVFKLTLIAIPIISYLAFYKYYQQGFFKTFIKWLLTYSAYIMILVMFILLFLLISLAIY